jgi:hypothetical protein
LLRGLSTEVEWFFFEPFVVSASPLAAIPSAPLRRDAAADVVVVGAGISGAMVAEALGEVLPISTGHGH